MHRRSAVMILIAGMFALLTLGLRTTQVSAQDQAPAEELSVPALVFADLVPGEYSVVIGQNGPRNVVVSKESGLLWVSDVAGLIRATLKKAL